MRGTVEAHVRREIVSPVEERVVAVGVRNADLVLLPQFGEARPVVQARAVGGLLVGHLRGNQQPAAGAKRKADVAERKSVGEGKGVSDRVDIGGGRYQKK